MRKMRMAAVVAAVVCCPLAAAAQTGAGSMKPAAPPVGTSGTYIGGFTGITAVQNVGAQFGGELGYQMSDRVSFFGEARWMQDVVTRRRLDLASSVATFVQTTQGASATGSVVAPSFYAGGGARIMLVTSGTIRPYVTGGAGVAHVVLKPQFTISGSDVSSNMTQYGVTLGSDLTGEMTKPAFQVGAGVLIPQGRWYISGEFGLTSIQTPDQTTNVLRAGVGIGTRF
jgi:hypothetical protein